MASKYGKMFSLKKWVTLDEAVETLSLQLSEKVTVADLYQLALDRHLKLSINLYNFTRARLGQTAPLDEANCSISIYPLFLLQGFGIATKKEVESTSISRLIRLLLDDKDGNPDLKIIEESRNIKDLPSAIRNYLESSQDSDRDKLATIIGESQECELSISIIDLVLPDQSGVIKLSEDITTIDGIWDIPLLGSDELDILHNLHCQELNGAEVTLCNLAGAWLENPETGEFAQLQESYADNEYCSEEERQEYRRKPEYYPAGGLPQDATLVVRTSELQRFIDGLSEEPRSNRKTENLQQKVIRSLATALNGAALTEQPTESEAQRFIDTVKSDYATDIPCSAKVLAKYMTSLD